jgi:NhaP-type Na+/H+ or K+/H+ antiporter
VLLGHGGLLRLDVLWKPVPLFGLIRPLAVAGLPGTQVNAQQGRLIAWFGIRGIGLIYTCCTPSATGWHRRWLKTLSITLAVVVASVVAHGVSVTPLMRRYENRAVEAGRATVLHTPRHPKLNLIRLESSRTNARFVNLKITFTASCFH